MALIFSLDQPLNPNISNILHQIKPFISCLKINHIQLAYASVSSLSKLLPHLDIFLDIKLYDIPNTVNLSITHYLKTINNLSYITIHGCAQDEMIISAIEATKNTSCKIVSVLQLSSSNSINQADFLAQGLRNYNLGIRCFIVPVPLITAFKFVLDSSNITIISPAIRPQTYQTDDQVFKGTPAEAKTLGANAIVVGRPIYLSNNPYLTTKEIYNEFHGIIEK